MSCREIRAHVSEPFWYIHVMYRTPEGQQCTFSWRRGHIYDHAIATVLYENCVDAAHRPDCQGGPARRMQRWIVFSVLTARSPYRWAPGTSNFRKRAPTTMDDDGQYACVRDLAVSLCLLLMVDAMLSQSLSEPIHLVLLLLGLHQRRPSTVGGPV